MAIITKNKKPTNSPLTWFLVSIILIVLGYSLLNNLDQKNIVDVPISTIQIDYQNAGQIEDPENPPSSVLEKIEIKGNYIIAHYTNGETKQAYKEASSNSVDLGLTGNNNVKVIVVDEEGLLFWSEIIFNILPFILIVIVGFYLLKGIAGQNKSAMSFGNTRATAVDKNKQKTTFNDVAGSYEAKQELSEVVDFLKNPKKYLDIGAKIPKGVLLFGAPGTGKTLLARAVAGEAKVPFFQLSGSEFVEMFVGVGASRVRDLFKKAKRNAPCIIFIDELDAVGRQRGAGVGGGHDEREQTLNQILTEMDGFEKEENVIVIAATNRPDVLDPALLRPGRFDRHVTLDRPDLKERQEILEVHIRKKPLEKNIKLEEIAAKTPGFVGAELENLLNESAILAARNNRKIISQKDVDEAIEKVIMGPERKGRVISEKERNIIAYHEAGHAISGHFLPNVDPVNKISIISRGSALGVTWFLPKEDEKLRSKSKFEDELASLLGGRIAEEIFFKDVTTGASNDLERATKIARDMVTRYGMSRLGNLTFGEHKGSVFLGRDLMHEKNYSEDTSKAIDAEVERIIKEAYTKSKMIITKHKKVLEEIAKELLKKESLSQEEFEKIIVGKKTKK